MKKVLLKDIAKLACVSQMTVSRVINTPEKVHPDTRQSVEDAMNRLNYRSNAVTQTSMAEKSRKNGGQVLFEGPLQELLMQKNSATAEYLRKRQKTEQEVI